MATDTATAQKTFSSFPSLHHFLTAVRRSEEGPIDRRLTKVVAAAPGSPSQESVGADGGYVVPPEFLGFMRTVLAEESLAGLCTGRTTTSNAVNTATDAQPPWATTGLKPKRQAEGAAVQQTKPVLEAMNCPLHALKILVPCTEEILEDAVGAELYFQAAFRERAAFQVNDWFLNGTGVAQPLGILNSPALLVQSKESGPQTADTLVLVNFSKMLSKLVPPSRSRSIWVFSPSAWNYLEGNLAGPQGSNALDYSGPRPRLLGLPVYESDAMQLLGDQGDVVLFDPTAVLAVTKQGGARFDLSVGVFYDLGLQAFRATFRLGLLPLWSAPVIAYRGTGQYSTIVTLEAR